MDSGGDLGSTAERVDPSTGAISRFAGRDPFPGGTVPIGVGHRTGPPSYCPSLPLPRP